MTTTGSIRLLSAGAVQAVIAKLAIQFNQETGHSVSAAFGTVGEVYDQLRTEFADVVIMSAPAIDEAINQGRVIATSRIHIARVGIGICIPTGTPLPDISSPEALKEVLLATPRLAYPNPLGSTAGRHFAKVLKDLNIAEEVGGKSLICPNGVTVCKSVSGWKAGFGGAMISEIRSVKEVELVGPLPKVLQLITTYTIGATTKMKDADTARAFIKFVAGADGKIFTDAGLNYKG